MKKIEKGKPIKEKNPSKIGLKFKNYVKKKGLKSFILSVIMIGLISLASLCLIFALYIIISAPNFDKEKLYTKEATVMLKKS